ncbi:MAG: AI-2E family transporter [Candidatus Firestonebacteria bacterium]
MEQRQNLKVWNWAKLFGIYFAILVALVIFYLAQDLLTPFLVAFILVYALNPLADKIESWGIKRAWAVAMIFIGFIVIAGLTACLGFESIKAEIILFKTQIPAYIERIKSSLTEIAAMLEAKIPNIKKGMLQEMITHKIGDLPTMLGEKMPYILKTLLGLITSTLIVLFLTFFILKDGREFRKNIIRIAPNKYFETVLCLLFEINKSVGNYIRGQLIDCTIVALLSVIGLSLIGLKYALIIGIICGITNIVPYLGPIMGMLPGIFIALVEHKSGTMAGSVVAVMMGVQLIDNVAVSPIAVGQSVNLHPIAVILSVTIGGALMGLWGMLLAVPIYCALKVTFQILYKGIIEYGSWENA